jgi:hypothetical protein
VEYYEKHSKNVKIDNRSEEILKLKLLYTYRSIPAAFLEVELPTFNYPVMFEEPEYSAIEHRGDTKQKISEDSFDDVILFSDPDYDKKLSDPLEELFFYFVRETEGNNPQEALPTR